MPDPHPSHRPAAPSPEGFPAKALIVLPTYNERENLPRIVPQILAQDPRLRLLIVDDNSPDGTGALADALAASDPRVEVMHRAGKLGLGTAYLAGFRYALERDYDVVFEMDADFSHAPEYIPDFLEQIKSADLVIGSRYITGVNVVNWPMKRLLLSYFASMYTRIISGLPLRDATGGFKCFRRSLLERIDFARVRGEGYSFQIEMNFLAWRKGARIVEIPIIFYDRAMGHSKMSNKIVREAVIMVWRLRLQALLGRA